VDEMRPLARSLKANALPFVVLYRPGVGVEAAMPVVLSRFSQFKVNLEVRLYYIIFIIFYGIS
jgi:hypothetical protein